MQADAPKLLLCPYCGERQPPSTECKACGGCFDQWSLKATQDDMGCWFVRDSRRPHFVGFSHEALVAAVRAGEIGMNAVVRGPTTRQLWTIARRAPGIAHLFGRCFACQAPVTEQSPKCAHCGAEPQTAGDRNFLGLPPVERVAPPADAKADLSAFLEDSSLLLVRIAPVVAPTALPRPQPQQFVPGAVAVTVRTEPEPAPVPAPHEHAPRSAFSPIHVGLAERARSLERANRLLFGLAVISFVVAVGLVVFTVAQSESKRREIDEKVAEAIRSVRSEFERKVPVVTPPPAELPPMPQPSPQPSPQPTSQPTPQPK